MIDVVVMGARSSIFVSERDECEALRGWSRSVSERWEKELGDLVEMGSVVSNEGSGGGGARCGLCGRVVWFGVGGCKRV